ncbi:hypothetical membrane protein [Rhodococcus rhodochrous]|uniref:cell division protein PerM n=1 Tax=Rhodococcus TaxID=1827 RepID=UPI00075122B1|nr:MULTISPECIES: DUF6350 family protein [Rhodococcus]MCB8912951.1 hypothetical protein [Rhodococcus rhodochrous]MDC3726862.1 hypothetical protein [Rhodococcus sp. Rp3]MDJ0399676.1 DUF6350 family protein [Rhodococcus rhodochrous]MDO1483448.1 hypothetical protein [Rhodococcus rhodochrous]TWH53106.1 hypothetical protein L612_000200004230 [Rhodococcus rhodochrous J38]
MTSTLGRSTRHVPTDDDSLDPERFRILLGTAARVPAVTLAVVATIVVTTMVVANSDLTGIYAAIAGTWLALHQVTLTIDGTSLGVLPLLPTAVLVWQAARGCASAADALVENSGYALDRQDISRITVAVLAGPLLVTAASLIVLQDAASVLPVTPPNAAAALAWVTGIYLFAALIGIGSRVWKPLVRYYAAPDWLVLAFRPALRVLLGLFALGGLAVVAGLLWSWNVVGELLARGDHWTGVLGLTVMSILYLPNVIIGAAAVLAGSTVHFGDIHLSLFEATGGDLPALPVLAAVPSGPAAAFWPVLLAVPATIGALLGRFAAQRTLQAKADGAPVGSADAAWTVLAAAAGAGLVTALATWVAGGPLGVFGTVGANWWLAGILVFAWSGLLGIITAQLLVWREGRLAAAALRADTEVGEETPEDAADAARADDTADGETDAELEVAENETPALEAPASEDAEVEEESSVEDTDLDENEAAAGDADEDAEDGASDADDDAESPDEDADADTDDVIDAEVVEVLDEDDAEDDSEPDEEVANKAEKGAD